MIRGTEIGTMYLNIAKEWPGEVIVKKEYRITLLLFDSKFFEFSLTRFVRELFICKTHTIGVLVEL